MSSWGTINILLGHKCSHFIEGNIDEKMLIEFVFDEEKEIRYDYLTVNEVGRGRIIYWAAGHSNDIPEDERILFINIISRLTFT